MNMFGLTLTLILYALIKKFSNCSFLKNIPPIVSVGVLIIFILKGFNIDYETYSQSANVLTFLLGPATVALALPLIKNKEVLSTNKRAIWLGFFSATFVAITSTFLIAKFFHAKMDVIMSLIPKSVTTPVALEISKALGGIPELTACIVIITGIVGAMFGHKVLEILKIKNDIAIGLSIGASSHVMGTASCVEKQKDRQAAISTLSLIIVGVLTAIIAPLLINTFVLK